VAGCLLSGAAGGAIVLAIHGSGYPAAATGYRPVPRAAGPGQPGAINATRLAAAIGPAVVNINTRLDALEGGGRAAGTGILTIPHHSRQPRHLTSPPAQLALTPAGPLACPEQARQPITNPAMDDLTHKPP
jgi:hypothetical protein